MEKSEGQLRLELGEADAEIPRAREIPSAQELAAGFDDMLGLGPDGRSSVFEADCGAAAIAATFRMLTNDPSLVGHADMAFTRLSVEEGEELDELRAAMVADLGSIVSGGTDRLIGALRALAVYGGPFQSTALTQLEALGSSSEAAPDGGPTSDSAWPGRALVSRASLITSVPGDFEELVLELTYPKSGPTTVSDHERERVGIVIVLDTFAGRQPIDAIVCDDLASFFDDAAAEDHPNQVAELPVTEAIALLAHSLWLFDRTLGAANHLPDDSDLLLHRPLVDRLVATHPHGDYETPEVDDLMRDEAVATFTKWLENEHPQMVESATGFVPLLVDFAADHAGDPARWSTVVAVSFLEMACHKVMAPPEELANVPDLVRLMIRWAHAEKGWPSDVTETTLAAVDQVQPLFDAELTGPSSGFGADVIPLGLPGVSPSSNPDFELLEPPVGGTHPEPFDEDDIPDALLDRTLAIARDATERAIDRFDHEFATLARRLIADAARHRDSPLGRGKTSIWASAAVYAVAQLNEIPGGWSPLALPSAEIMAALDGAPVTITGKAKALRDLLEADSFPPQVRYQHSTSVAATGDVLSSMFGLMARFEPGSGGGPGAHLGSLQPPVAVEPGSVDPDSVGADCFVLRVSLVGIRPEIWRRVRLPVGATFAQLHQLLQQAFGWYGSHLHAFDFGSYTAGPSGRDFGRDLSDDVDEAELRLCDAVGPGSELMYLYDFGDNWEHRIVVEGAEDVDARTDIATGEPMARFAVVGGAMAGPPEDCGGPPGYADLVRSMKDKQHPLRAELVEWMPPGFDPKHFDAYTLNQAIQRREW